MALLKWKLALLFGQRLEKLGYFYSNIWSHCILAALKLTKSIKQIESFLRLLLFYFPFNTFNEFLTKRWKQAAAGTNTIKLILPQHNCCCKITARFYCMIWVCTCNFALSFEVILILSIRQMKKCTGLNSLSPYNNESKSSCNLCYGIFSFIVLVPGVRNQFCCKTFLTQITLRFCVSAAVK